MLEIVCWWKKYYVYDGLNFYGPFHSVEEASYRAPNKGEIFIRKTFGAF